MTAQLRSELLKMRTTAASAPLLLAAAAVTLLGVLVEALSPTLAELAQEDTQRTVFGAAGSSAVLFATFVGLIALSGEFRYGTIRPTLLFEPRRRVVVAAKLAVSALAGVLVAVVCVAVCFGAGLAVLATRDVHVALTSDHTRALIFGTAAACPLGAMLGVAVGALIRNQAGAIVAVVAYAVAVDAVLFAAIPSVGRYLPGKAGDALTGQPVENLLAPGLGAAVLVAWTLVFIAAAIARTDRTDI
jgi:ABC-2 type transport system permease protein